MKQEPADGDSPVAGRAAPQQVRGGSASGGCSATSGGGKRGSYAVHKAEDALEMLRQGVAPARPSRILDSDTLTQQIFLEDPLLKRVKGDDRWVTSGGRKGATEIWATDHEGVLKRYGRVVREGSTTLKFAQYSLISRVPAARGQAARVVDSNSRALWVVHAVPSDDAVQPWVVVQGRARPTPPRGRRCPPAATRVLQSRQPSHSVVALKADHGNKFLSFQTAAGDEVDNLELGAVVRNGRGIKLETSQGDFAEWHRLAPDEPPLEEGDVVGFERGMLTRRTRGCEMLAVVSRMAAVEGSAPPPQERHRYECVAYAGVVPVKLARVGVGRGGAARCDCTVPKPGQLLSPSGREDGTAVLLDPTTSTSAAACPRVAILLDDARADEFLAGSSGDPGHVLVSSVVIAPTQTVPYLGGRSMKHTRSIRRAVWLLLGVLLAATLSSTLDLALMNTEAARGSCPHGGASICAAGHGVPRRSTTVTQALCDGPICRFDECCVDACTASGKSAPHSLGVLRCDNDAAAAGSPGKCARIPASGVAAHRSQAECRAVCANSSACVSLMMYHRQGEAPTGCCFHQPTPADLARREHMQQAGDAQCDCFEYDTASAAAAEKTMTAAEKTVAAADPADLRRSSVGVPGSIGPGSRVEGATWVPVYMQPL